jgi:hypothetical protein
MMHVDVDFHMKRWIAFLESDIYKCSLEPTDFIFPAFSTNAEVKRHSHISHDVVQDMIHHYSLAAGICLGTDKFTTHCYRRGGVQYRFMFAPFGQHWTMARIRWWGGVRSRSEELRE